MPSINTALKLTDLLPRLVYDCFAHLPQDPSPQGHNKYVDKLIDYYTPMAPNDPTLVFESRFESGNLHRATQISEFEYDLELKFDHGATA